MDTPQQLIVFYQAEPINVQDIDREIYTKDKRVFHLFFFHNFNLNIEKSDLFKKVLLKEFEAVQPEMYIDLETSTIKMIKKITNINFNKLDKNTEKEYKKYLDNINYRIKCILDTFKLFNRLYKDKTIIYIIPQQLSKKIKKILKVYNLSFENIVDKEQLILYYDIIYWANYFSRVNQESLKKETFKNENLTNIIKLIDNN